MGLRGMPVVLAGGLALLACTHTVSGSGSAESSSSGGSGGLIALAPSLVGTLCDLLTRQCQTTKETLPDCVRAISPVRTSPECADMIVRASCTDLDALQATCFPACDPSSEPECHADGTLSTCNRGDNGGSLVTLSCADGCVAAGSSYSGICGVTGPAGQPSPNGRAQCWCN